MDDESADHCAVSPAAPARVASCFSPNTGVGDGRGLGVGVGVVVGGWVTKVIVCGCARCWPAAVVAVGPMVTWYCVLGARLPLAGCTTSVFTSHEKLTLVAGVICTAASVVVWFIGWLNWTWIGWARGAPLLPASGLCGATGGDPPWGWPLLSDPSAGA